MKTNIEEELQKYIVWPAETSRTGVIINSAWMKTCHAVGFNFPLTEDVDLKHLPRGSQSALIHFDFTFYPLKCQMVLFVKLKALYVPMKWLQSLTDQENHCHCTEHVRSHCNLSS